jgi:uncharacterized DUF497 family protein
MLILGFEWDDHNEPKLEKHGLDRSDVEYLFERSDPVIVAHPTHPDRLMALGFFPNGRFAVASFEYDDEFYWVRVVTAYEPESDTLWRVYETYK